MNNKDQLTSKNLILITGQRSYTYSQMHVLIVELALLGPLKLLIGGNRYDHYGINYALAARSSRYEHILKEHIFLSRAETCYQMVELLIQTQADHRPSLVLDILATFHDEGVPEREINQLLFEAISALRRLSQLATVVVSACLGQNRPHLLNALEKAVDRVEYPPMEPPEAIHQYNLSE
ncbi:MAG: hypothetical protein HQ525_11930 [Anaerolineae bacterium]|uniref:Uncharacterized protein n=1 Tax=Candidatus Desulfolinea nitratireducens TaxID=2841698 RepID=A0A8J6THL4_9CHLR|nr:hypothetical protein [Candidatus Desulfolinea nitratireducens]MBL6959775.1 hypothetical protein [Anaerolineales bacterium]NQU31365.1 hypothetical protein [Anaerolineae bacterium]